MTSSTTTSQDVKEIQDRQSNGRGAVIDATMVNGITVDPALIEAAMMALVEHWRAEADIWEASKKRGGIGTAKELRQCAARLAGFAVGLTTRPVTLPDPVITEDLPGMWEESDLSGGLSDMADLEASACPHPAYALSLRKDGTTLCTLCQAVWAMDVVSLMTGSEDVVAALPVGDSVAEVLAERQVLLSDLAVRMDVAGVEIVAPLSEYITTSEEQNLRDIIGPLGASATALVDNPFTRPNVPWLNRPAVEVIPYEGLSALAAATGAREHVSHSYVEGYESCSLASMLKDASRAGHIGASRPMWSGIAGNAFHAAVEAVERAALTNVTLAPTGADLEAFWMAFLDAQIKEHLAALVGTPYADSGTWYVSNRGKEGFDWWRVEGARMLKLYLDYHTPAWRAANQTFLLQDKTPVIELEYDMTIRSLDQERGLRAKGSIDKATLNMETYSLTVLDYKTGANDPSSTFQLGEYGHALLMAMGIAAEPPDRPILGAYWLARKGIYTTPTAVLARHPMAELQYRYDQAARGNRAGIFAPHVSNFCTSCSVKDYCPTQAGRT